MKNTYVFVFEKISLNLANSVCTFSNLLLLKPQLQCIKTIESLKSQLGAALVIDDKLLLLLFIGFLSPSKDFDMLFNTFDKLLVILPYA